ncbi:MAG: hypothetical protein IPO00_05805 [Betaproteobacteria bacterium]|nr:hypothetical protein [Betaproteobacteria bacterium]
MTPFPTTANRAVAQAPSINMDNWPFSGIDLSVAAAAVVLWLALSFV